MKLSKLILFWGLCFLGQLLYAQLENNCGIPEWSATFGYPSNSFVLHDDHIYTNSIWLQNEEPGVNTNWTLIGTCNEQLLINYPELAYTECANIDDWDSTTNNYNTDDKVHFNHGVYRAKYWVSGTEQPNLSEAYEFLGICIHPITITPTLNNHQVIIQNPLDLLLIQASIETQGFSVIEHTLGIKKVSEDNFTTYNMSLNNGTISYSWLPETYGDYVLKYYLKNAIHVESELIINIKIAASTPPNIVLTTPISGASFIQLNFETITITTNVSPTDNPIDSIVFVDETANSSENILISTPNQNTDYTIQWIPQQYGNHALKLIVTDTQGTFSTLNFNYTIIDPTIESLSFDDLPYQIKAVHGIEKAFHFDASITSVKSRNYPLTSFEFDQEILTIGAENPGRTGLEITTADGNKHYLGLRIDYNDGTVVKYPPHIAIGSVSEDIIDDVTFFNEGINNTDLIKNNRMDVRYIYINGGPINGWNTWQPDRAIKFARNSLKMGLIPFFIFYNIPDGGESYTTNLAHIQDPAYMTAYFENLDLFLNQVKEVIDDEFFGVIFEPDFLGYMQQNSEPPTLVTSVSANTIDTNAGTLQSLVERINFEIHKKRVDDALNLEFGWQLNLWAKPNVAGIRGIIRETDTGDFQEQLDKIRQTAVDIFEYGDIMGIMSSHADFISIDKYGLDALGYSSGSTPSDPSSYTWFWNNDHWLNYFEFVKSLNEASGKQIILWQIPVGHINGSVSTNAYTGTTFELLDNTSKHYEDSATTFFFGDTVDFSNDMARLSYFSENQHNDPKLVVEGNFVSFGNHFAELNEVGVKLVLMGAGVGDSTDGIGDPTEPGATLTDDHFWIQKVQNYYIHHLIESTLNITDYHMETNTKNDLKFWFETHHLVIKNLNNQQQEGDVLLFNLSGQNMLPVTTVSIAPKETQFIPLSKAVAKGIYICVFIDTQSKRVIIQKILKQL